MTNANGSPELDMSHTGLGPMIDRKIQQILAKSFTEERLTAMVESAIQSQVSDCVRREVFDNKSGWFGSSMRQRITAMVAAKLAGKNFDKTLEAEVASQWKEFKGTRGAQAFKREIAEIVRQYIYGTNSSDQRKAIQEEIIGILKESLKDQRIEWANAAIAAFLKTEDR